MDVLVWYLSCEQLPEDHGEGVYVARGSVGLTGQHFGRSPRGITEQSEVRALVV